MAYEHFARRDLKEARPFADKALEHKPHHPLASYVKAQLLVTIGDDDAALAVLEPALDPKQPNERVIDLLGELKMKAGQLDEAEALYELARKDDPFRTKWISWLARIHLRQKKTDQFLSDLAMIAIVRCRQHRRSQGTGRATPDRWETLLPPRNGPRSACTSTSMIRRSMSFWPTLRPPERSSPPRSRNIRPHSS